jgi:hypothetical protein
MTTHSDREVILERIRRLFALSKDGGATSGESTTAAKMAARLMAQYQLSEADLRVHRDDTGVFRVDVSENDVAQAVWRSGARRMPRWQATIAPVVARATGCRAYRTREGIVFVGAFRDATVAAEIQAWLVGRCEADTRAYLRSPGREPSRSGRATASSFRTGWVAGVRTAVDAEVAARRGDAAEVPTEPTESSGSALVAISLRDISDAKDKAVSSWMARHVGRLSTTTHRTTVRDGAAYGAGRSKGSSVQVGAGANLR